jgi:hypothetical protein
MSKTTNDKPTFEIGLVMAGAVSAGAYTAGVLDFLIQALDAWYKERDNDPPHDIKIKVMSGASAGGMTAALAATLVNRELEHVTGISSQKVPENKLYDCWVEQIDIQQLLEDTDLQDEDSEVTSLLNSSRLDAIADRAFRGVGQLKDRPYFDSRLHILLSVNMHFVVTEEPIEDMVCLDPKNLESAEWEMLKDAALATGAFPIGLAPRKLTRKAQDYDRREWLRPVILEDNKRRSFKNVPIEPYWATGYKPDEYEFLCVDGGLMDNEPMELARGILAGSRSESNPREGSKAHRAIVMIDPFPNVAPVTTNYTPDRSLLSVFGQMFSSLRAQVCFKLEELKLSRDDEICSRFMIAPSRSNWKAGQPLLACGSLGAFGGFLWKKFREHDFQLGRRNCQRFLQKRFVLPAYDQDSGEGNFLFRDWSEELRTEHRVIRQDREFLPIIPVVKSLREPEERDDWPKMPEARLESLVPQIQKRVGVVLSRLIPQETVTRVVGGRWYEKKWARWLIKLLVAIVWKWIGGRIKKLAVKYIVGEIRKDLGNGDLLESSRA